MSQNKNSQVEHMKKKHERKPINLIQLIIIIVAIMIVLIISIFLIIASYQSQTVDLQEDNILDILSNTDPALWGNIVPSDQIISVQNAFIIDNPISLKGE